MVNEVLNMTECKILYFDHKKFGTYLFPKLTLLKVTVVTGKFLVKSVESN